MLEKKSTKAIALYSGGLDSTLSILVIKQQGIEVEAVYFVTNFGCDKNSEWALKVSRKFGFEVRFFDIEDKFLETLRNPRYGYGKNMNPCVDCRILMLKEAKKYMNERGAHFVITGEVLNQRPFSQRRQFFKTIDREAGLSGYVLRPLTALCLEPTIPEKEGLVKRDLLYGFEGRSRKPQMALAQRFGLYEYPTPAGGCLLTDPIYSLRLRELLKTNPEVKKRDIYLLKIGRHFRLNPECKVIVGRNKKENEMLESIGVTGDILLKAVDFPGPTVLIVGSVTEHEIDIAASICARYSDGKLKREIRIKAYIVTEKNGEPSKEVLKECIIHNVNYDFIERLLIAPKPFQKSL
ncbi:MAG: 7-cyano-7-deazaguanine synthase [Deltaproteobacteria bacterium]|nr:7-cyano-7-deazaguanine synthase [Deltaproteobacteria bacterium]